MMFTYYSTVTLFASDLHSKANTEKEKAKKKVSLRNGDIQAHLPSKTAKYADALLVTHLGWSTFKPFATAK